jgi:hypothetical protein
MQQVITQRFDECIRGLDVSDGWRRRPTPELVATEWA